MTTTPRLGITQWEEDQALPEAVGNEAVAVLEMFATRLIVKSQGDNSPPGSPAAGDAYLIGSTGTGAWSGHDEELALYINGAWEFVTPKEGFEIEVEDEDVSYILRGGTWTATGESALALAPEWAPNFTSDGDLYIPAIEAMTISQGNAAIGTGTITFEKSTTAAPSTFSSTTLPATLQAGAWLKVIAASVSGFVATHLVRTA